MQAASSSEKEIRQALKPQKVLRLLRDGNIRFRTNLGNNQKLPEKHFVENEQCRSLVTILTCADNFMQPEKIFDQPAEIFHKIYTAGDVVNDDVLHKLEVSHHLIEAKMIVVLGHTNCPTIKSICSTGKSVNLMFLLEKIHPPIRDRPDVSDSCRLTNHKLIDFMTEIYVRSSVNVIVGKSFLLRRLIEKNGILLLGAMYDASSGRVRFF